MALPLAKKRLKSNLGALALLTFARTLFTPYLYFRGLLVRGIDQFATSPRTQHGVQAVWYLGARVCVLTDTRNCNHVGVGV